MTTATAERIAELRRENYSYRFIGDALQISPNTVKSICRRRGYEAKGPRKTKAEKQNTLFCKNCHKLLPEGTRKDAIFCSDYCRSDWRRKNRKIREINP